MTRFFENFLDVLGRVEDLLCSCGLIFCTFATIFQIINRYWLHIEIVWIGEFLLYVFTLTVILSIVITTRENAHTNVDILIKAIAKRSHRLAFVLNCVLNAASILTVVLLIPIFGKYALKAHRYPEWGALCPWFNASWLIEAVFVMFLLSACHMVAHFYLSMRGKVHLDEGKERAQ